MKSDETTFTCNGSIQYSLNKKQTSINLKVWNQEIYFERRVNTPSKLSREDLDYYVTI